LYTYIYIYIHIHMPVHIYIYIETYIYTVQEHLVVATSSAVRPGIRRDFPPKTVEVGNAPPPARCIPTRRRFTSAHAASTSPIFERESVWVGGLVGVCVCVHVCVCMCVCVCTVEKHTYCLHIAYLQERECMWVGGFVGIWECVWEREREGDRERECVCVCMCSVDEHACCHHLAYIQERACEGISDSLCLSLSLSLSLSLLRMLSPFANLFIYIHRSEKELIADLGAKHNAAVQVQILKISSPSNYYFVWRCSGYFRNCGST